MVAKISKGNNFGGAVRYVLQEMKGAMLLDSLGVLATDRKSIITSFRFQCEQRPDIKDTVGHLSLSFSVEDAGKVNESFMVSVAREYMRRMGIRNTQYIIVAHHDRTHPHCHIVYNRIDNNGCLISNKNDRRRNVKVCKQLTRELHLHMAKGKEHVNRERLRGADAVKYQIYDALVAAVPLCNNWKELEEALRREGVKISFVNRGSTNDIQGVVFEKDGIKFNGSNVDRRFSYSKISKSFVGNTHNERRRMVMEKIDGNGYVGGKEIPNMSPVIRTTLSTVDYVVSRALHTVAEVGPAPVSDSVSPDGRKPSVDLADDEYIDEYGIIRKRRRGLRR